MIPNIITTCRLLLVPIFAYMMACDNYFAAAIIFIISGVSDVIDGYIARHFNMITRFGMIYDPFVDKLMQITAIVCLVIKDIIPPWLLIFVLLKEVSMILVGGILYIKKIEIKSNKYGKAATVIFYAGVLLLITWKSMPSVVFSLVISLMILAMLVAAIYYATDIIKHYDEKRVTENKKE